MFFNNHRHELESRAAHKVASAGGPRLQNSAFANTFLAPILANRFPFIITPYLGLRARLSQVWINRWTVLLLLVLVRTLIAIASLREDIQSARREALSACSGVEDVGSAMASMPHYMSQGVNALTADGVERAVNGLMSMLLLTVTGVEEIVLFVINMLTSTYVCLITLVIRGALHAAVELIEGVSHFLNKSLGEIGHDLHTTIADFQSAYNDFLNGLSDVDHFLGGDTTIPTLNVTAELDKLNNLHLPSGLDSDLQTLNKNMPTFEQVHKFTNNAISWPFEEIKKLINDSLPNYKFDRNMFPVPEKQQLTFCSDNNGINNFFDGLMDLGILARKVAIAVLVILAALVCGPMAWLEIRRNRKLRERAALVRDASTAPADAVYIASRPFTSSAGLKAASAFTATRRQHLVRWAVAYATTVPALFVLSLGVAGLFSCLCRYIILQFVQREVPDLTNEVADFADRVVTSLDNASEAWANGTNAEILKLSSKINHDVFGWVNSSTTAVNHTLNVFVDESIDAIRDVFGGTILYNPVKGLFKCLIGLKITNIEKGLTWVHDHAHIDFPLLPVNTFSLGAASSLTSDPQGPSFLSSPGSGATDAITAIVDALAAHFARSIRTEAIISATLVAVWVLVALIGIVRAAWLFYGKGHMPDDVDGSGRSTVYPGARELDGTDPAHDDGNPFADPLAAGNAAGEKSPSFVGDMYHSPSIAQTTYPHSYPPEHPQDQTQEDQRAAAFPPDTKTAPPPAYANAQHPAHANIHTDANEGNYYHGASYTLAPRAFPRFSAGPPPDEYGARGLSPVPENGVVGHAGERDVGGAKRKGGRGLLRRSDVVDFAAVRRDAAGGGGEGKGARSGVTFDGMGH